MQCCSDTLQAITAVAAPRLAHREYFRGKYTVYCLPARAVAQRATALSGHFGPKSHVFQHLTNCPKPSRCRVIHP